MFFSTPIIKLMHAQGTLMSKGQVCPASSEPVCYIHTYMGLARKLMNILVYEIMNQISQPKLDTPSMAYVHGNAWCITRTKDIMYRVYSKLFSGCV